jgi:tetratricopeptide (TPR) repeat protein
MYVRPLAGYDFDKLDAESLGHAADLFRTARDLKEQVRALDALVMRARDVPAQQMFDRATELADLHRAGGQYDVAVKVYERAESQLAAPKQKAVMLLAAGRVLLEDLNRPAEAEQRFRRVVKEFANVGTMVVREAQIGLGDVACRRGDREAAAAAFAEAEKVPVGGLATTNPTLRTSALARYVEEYTRTKDFDSAEEFLRTWYREFPSHRMIGDVVVIEQRLRLAQEKYDRVLRLANDLVGVNRDSPHAAEALLLGAKAAVKLDRREEARRDLAQIIDDYPEAACRKEAAELLETLGGRPGGAKAP